MLKRFLKAVLAFLEAKFPDRLEVAYTEYQALQALAGRLEQAYTSVCERLDATEQRLAKAEDKVTQATLALVGMGISVRGKTLNVLER